LKSFGSRMARSARVTGIFLEVRSLQGVFSSGHEKVSRLEASPDFFCADLATRPTAQAGDSFTSLHVCRTQR
jgi:hypothetical protein